MRIPEAKGGSPVTKCQSRRRINTDLCPLWSASRPFPPWRSATPALFDLRLVPFRLQPVHLQPFPGLFFSHRFHIREVLLSARCFLVLYEVPAPDETATYNLLREHLGEVLNGLPPREVRILQLRYGLLDGQAYTLEEVGRKMGVTRERVRQIEAQALSRLRHPSIRRKLRDYLGE